MFWLIKKAELTYKVDYIVGDWVDIKDRKSIGIIEDIWDNGRIFVFELDTYQKRSFSHFPDIEENCINGDNSINLISKNITPNKDKLLKQYKKILQKIAISSSRIIESRCECWFCAGKGINDF